MKRLKKYYINDGLDGIILAKSLKQAIKILTNFGYCYPSLFLKEIKKENGFFKLTNVKHLPKKGINKKPRFVGWYE